MFWNPLRKRVVRDAGERFRKEHSRFLTHASLSGRIFPEIPTRQTDRGGFDALRSRKNGSIRASQWWAAAFNRVD
jgi:hypothetical protein